MVLLLWPSLRTGMHRSWWGAGSQQLTRELERQMPTVANLEACAGGDNVTSHLPVVTQQSLG